MLVTGLMDARKKEPRRALGKSERHLRGATPKRAFLAKAVF